MEDERGAKRLREGIIQLRGLGLVLAAAVVAAGLSGALAQERPEGLKTPVVLPAFDRDAPACAPPTGLTRVLTFAQDNDRAFIAGVGAGLQKAAGDRGLEYVSRVAESSATIQTQQVREAVAAKSGAIIARAGGCGGAPCRSRSDLAVRMWALSCRLRRRLSSMRRNI